MRVGKRRQNLLKSLRQKKSKVLSESASSSQHAYITVGLCLSLYITLKFVLLVGVWCKATLKKTENVRQDQQAVITAFVLKGSKIFPAVTLKLLSRGTLIAAEKYGSVWTIIVTYEYVCVCVLSCIRLRQKGQQMKHTHSVG